MKAIFAGTFDPFTTGHRDIAERALSVFGNVTVAVANDTGKTAQPIDVRLAIAKDATSDLSGVAVEPFSGLLSDYLAAQGDCVIVRGVRNTRDMEYERDHVRIYKSLCGKDAVLFITSAEYEHVSSTVVRQLAALGGTLDGYVAERTAATVAKYYGK
ncbi:MAG: pantetheine-phosphate adenylyltransferase [Clostridiales bacterium]|nr:pantetheine-phosphate adenylyltransferase [Clostridiales bacterium]